MTSHVMTPESLRTVLRLVAVFTAFSGFAVAMPFASGGLFWPLDGAQTISAPEPRVFAAIFGGLTVSLGVFVFQIATHLLPAGLDLARRLTVPSVIAWFLVDSTGSVLACCPGNVVPNLVVLVSVVGPFVLARSTPVARPA
jgi:hypothetical protein